jgi:hypothetical protein
MGDIKRLQNDAANLLEDIENIVCFTISVIDYAIKQCSKGEITCKIEMVQYMDYKDLHKFKDYLEKIIKDSQKFNSLEIRPYKGPLLRIYKFLDKLIDLTKIKPGFEFDFEAPYTPAPIYVVIDPAKKTFIPLLLTHTFKKCFVFT